MKDSQVARNQSMHHRAPCARDGPGIIGMPSQHTRLVLAGTLDFLAEAHYGYTGYTTRQSLRFEVMGLCVGSTLQG